MKNTVLFDLGNTLVQYYTSSESPTVIGQSIIQAQAYLRQKGLLNVSPETMWRGVENENYEAPDYRVRPLEGRLARIFQLDPTESPAFVTAVCRQFLKPIFALGHCYEDTQPTLEALRAKGFRTAIVSNTPWGSPAHLWREEIARFGLSELVDAVVFCTDVGWRKPAKQIFECALQKVQALPQQCLFVGDDPKWDLAGPGAMGIEAVLINRRGTRPPTEEAAIRSLDELWDRLQP
jgi:putative hydrolase of the HAD superfamily